VSVTSQDQLRQVIVATDPAIFVSRYLLEPIPHVFFGDISLWVEWKTKLATHLEVDPYEIVVAGSGALGFSLNPKNELSAFNDSSDIDVCVISHSHFEAAWRYLRTTKPSWLSLPKSTRNAFSAHRRNYVFEGAIATDLILPFLPFGKRWQAGLDEMAKVEPTKGREVKLRIYRDFDALRAYQIQGVIKAKTSILDSGEESEEIKEDT